MKQVSHRELEALRRNPQSYGQRVARGWGRGPSRFQRLKDAIGVYHSQGMTTAMQHLEESFAQGHHSGIDSYRNQLIIYDGTFRQLGASVIRWRHNISIELGPDLVMTGQVDRIDRLGKTVAVWLFSKTVIPDWDAELRAPILQDYFAEMTKFPLEEVSIGHYFFVDGTYRAHCYSRDEILMARQEASVLAAALMTAESASPQA